MNVKEWGFCPHQDEGMCEDCTIDPSQRSFHQSELAELTHATQVEIFGWCSCEDNKGNENPYTDCPTNNEGEQQ
jgi:hypothetical protein